ncbi:uncharacterized protein LOC141680672 [Apium graveolens]|uniref:uncharacterized protein LOC141680672 n=1 Tax=Apium graveolens TaxID=4045 RepID=UPI003D7A1A1E
MNQDGTSSFAEWMVESFDTWPVQKRQEAAMLCWSLWKGRNNLVWNQKGLEASEVVVSARMALNKWKKAQDNMFDNFLGLMTMEDGSERWMVPDQNTVKINCDAATFEDSNCYSSTFVVRNDRGEVLKARSKCRVGSTGPDSAEAMEVREALSWTQESKHQNIMIETDCLVVVQAMRGSDLLSSYFGVLVKECKSLIHDLSSRSVSVRFVKRSANKVADFLAKATYSPSNRIWRVSDHPGFINVLMNDLI